MAIIGAQTRLRTRRSPGFAPALPANGEAANLGTKFRLSRYRCGSYQPPRTQLKQQMHITLHQPPYARNHSCRSITGRPVLRAIFAFILALAFIAQSGTILVAEQQPDAQTTSGKKNINNEELEAALEERLRQLDNLYTPIHWADPVNGLAIGGFDPISYFEVGRAIKGNNEFQKAWHGVGWRFQSEGNRILFAASPSVYAPRFAGYDPYAISNGIAAQGNPTIWEIIGGRLYFFHNEVNRYLWHENHQKLAALTNQNWAELATDLPQYKVIARKDRELDFGQPN